MALNLGSDRRSAWCERLARYQSSPLTIFEFCISEGVSPSSFYQWRKKLEPRASRESTVVHSTASFAPVRLVGSTNVVVQLPGGTRLEIPLSDTPALERALEALVRADARCAEAASC